MKSHRRIAYKGTILMYVMVIEMLMSAAIGKGVCVHDIGMEVQA